MGRRRLDLRRHRRCEADLHLSPERPHPLDQPAAAVREAKAKKGEIDYSGPVLAGGPPDRHRLERRADLRRSGDWRVPGPDEHRRSESACRRSSPTRRSTFSTTAAGCTPSAKSLAAPDSDGAAIGTRRMPLPTVAIVGRPNVGKSTLFNRLVGKRLALVDDRPGVTRDRREGEANLLGLDFRVIDTAGFEDEDPQTLPGRMRQQTEAAVRDADAALFMIDAREGLTPLDEEIGRWLRAESDAGDRRREQGGGPRLRKGHPRGVSAGARRSDRAQRRAWRRRRRPVPGASAACRSDEEHEEEEDGEGAPLKLAIVGRPERRQVDARQPHARRRADDHRPRSGDHARFDQHRMGVGRPRRAPGRYRRPAEARQGRRQARAAIGGRHAAGDRLCRGRRPAARRHARTRSAGPARSRRR